MSKNNLKMTDSGSGVMKCMSCKSRVVDPTLCPGCAAAYHPSCATSKTTLIPGVGYAKCCGSRPTSPLAATSLDGKSILDLLRHELKVHADAMSKEFSSVMTSVTNLTEDFKTFGVRLSSVETGLASVSERLDNVEGKVMELESRPNSSSDSMSDYLSEWEERHRRKCNVMIFGLKEARGADRMENMDIEARVISDFVSLVLPGISDQAMIKHSRIGKLSQVLATPRPVKLTLPTEELASTFIKAISTNSNEALSRGAFKDVRITFDRTRRQLEEYKELRKLLDARVSSGEANLRIVYRNGAPKIVQTSRPHHT